LLDRVQAFRLQQTKLAGTGDRFSAPVDLKFAKEVPRVSFHCVQGKEQPLAYLLIREALGHELEDFDLASAEGLDVRLGRRRRRLVFVPLLLRFKYRTHLLEIVWHQSLRRDLGQEVCHRGALVDKGTDAAPRLGQRQGLTEHLYCLVQFALGLKR
jgi:hypothetical protein